MRSRTSLRSFVIGALALVLAPSAVHAQSTIAGVVKDASGAVLPGVVVEATSPVLIEKTRSVVTNGEGRYAIVDIRPGTYSVTFTLTGFNTFKRDGVEVPTNVSVPINADMKVGALEETVTVSGASPVVDVQNTAKVNVMSRDLIDTIPSARNLQSVGALVPGIRLNIPDVGGAQQTEQTYMATHGNASLHNTVLLDGMPAQTNLVDGQVQNYIDNALIAEATYQTSGVTAESSGGGVRVNMIPKDGGNTVHGSGFFGGSADSWHLQADNLTPDLVARGLKTGARIQHVNDFNGAVGGPIVKDKLWYFGSGRYQSTFLQIPNTFNTDGSPGIEDADIKSFVVRGTWQATPRNKFAVTLPAELQVEGARDFERRPDGSAGDAGHLGDAARPAPVLHRSGQVDVAHHQQAARGGRLLERHPALFEPVRARDWTTARNAGLVRDGHSSEHDDQPAHGGRPVQPVVLSEPGQRRRLADVRHRIAHRQDGHAVGIRVQRLRQRHERRLVAELPEFRNGADSGVGHRLQLAPQHVSGTEGEHRPVCPGPVGVQEGHYQLRDSLRIPE